MLIAMIFIILGCICFALLDWYGNWEWYHTSSVNPYDYIDYEEIMYNCALLKMRTSGTTGQLIKINADGTASGCWE